MTSDELQKLAMRCIKDAFEVIEFPAEWKQEIYQRAGAEYDGCEHGKSDIGNAKQNFDNALPTDLNVLLSGINDVTNMIVSGQELNEILTAILETIYRGLGLNRALLLIYNSSKKTLVVRFGFAPDLDALMKSMYIETSGTDTISEALKNNADLIVDEPEKDNFTNMPSWYSRTLNGSCFSLFPIIVNDSLIGAIYLDSLISKAFSERNVELVKSLRNQAALAIKVS